MRRPSASVLRSRAVCRPIRPRVPCGFTCRANWARAKPLWCVACCAPSGVTVSVKSPSYSLLESYACPPWRVLHLDFYRLSDPQEVLALGLADHDERHTLWLVEWPERGGSMLPTADLIVRLSGAASAHRLAFEAHGSVGESWLRRVSQEPEFSDAEH